MICIDKFLGPCDSDANKVTITILRPPRHHNRRHFSIFVMTQDVLASIIHSSPRGLTLGEKFFIGRPCLVSCYSERCLKQPGGGAPWWQSLGITIEMCSCILVDKVPAVSNHNSRNGGAFGPNSSRNSGFIFFRTIAQAPTLNLSLENVSWQTQSMYRLATRLGCIFVLQFCCRKLPFCFFVYITKCTSNIFIASEENTSFIFKDVFCSI